MIDLSVEYMKKVLQNQDGRSTAQCTLQNEEGVQLPNSEFRIQKSEFPQTCKADTLQHIRNCSEYSFRIINNYIL